MALRKPSLGNNDDRQDASGTVEHRAGDGDATVARVYAPIGPYQPRGFLGEGGMGEVLLAEGPSGDLVALKVLAAAPANSALARRLEREGRVIEGLDHPNIVRVLDHGVDPASGRPYVALEYVRGRSLIDTLKDHPSHRLPFRKAAFVLDACADALGAIHELGVLHRDVKPGNVFIDNDGQVKLFDFGLALAEDVSQRLTHKMEVVGTPAYLPPEVLLRTQDWCPASDLYSLGCLAFHIIAGQPPFCGDLKQVLAGQMWQPPQPIEDLVPDIPPALASLISDLLEKDPDMRPTVERTRQVLSLFAPQDGPCFWPDPEEVPADAPAVEMANVPAPGTMFGRYRLVEELGRGGMGVVYRAEDTHLKRTVALKLILGGEFASPEANRRFLREAESVAALDHPNIVRVFDVGEHQDIPFLSMELVEGKPLSEMYRDNDIGPAALLRTFLKICDGVQHAHFRGVIHRDLKPQNVLVDANREPRILDFGLAKRVSAEGLPDHSLTGDGSVLGTLRYMAPEQMKGENDKIDVRSDVYGLGGILYELVTRGRAPYEGVLAQVAYDLLRADPPPPSARNKGVPWELDAICLKAIEKKQDHRYQSALTLQSDVRRYLEGVPILARQGSLLYRLRKGVRRHKVAVMIAVLLLAATVGTFLTIHFAERRQRVEIARLLKEARAAPLAERPQLFSEILGVDPDNKFAALERDVAERELAFQRAAQEKLRLEKERGKRELAEEELRTEKAQAGLREVEARDAARQEAEEQERARTVARAQKALDRAKNATQATEEISALRSGLLLLPPGRSALRDTLETRMVKTASRLTKTALERGEPGLARFWLREAGQVDAAKAQSQSLAALTRRVELLESGQGSRSEALELMRSGEWLAARDKLLLARRRGVPNEVIEEDLGVVRSRCREIAEALLGESRRLLGEKKAALALQKSKEVLSKWADSEEERQVAQSLVETAAARIAASAQMAALRHFNDPGGADRGMSTLATAARLLVGTPAGKRLTQELEHRGLHQRDNTLAGCVYVPTLANLRHAPFFIARREVTNAEYEAFVEAGGYADATLFDKEARSLRAEFLDGTPGDKRSPGPRVWQYGGYGDAANATRPVRGVTWYEARAYARWLSRKTGQHWRLPTVEEWQVAAGWDPEKERFRRYPFGDAFDNNKTPWAGVDTRAVGATAADRSPLGIFDAGGNVSEWVTTTDQTPRPALKGASFAVPAKVAQHQAQVRTTGHPTATPPASLTRRLGFRLVRAIKPASDKNPPEKANDK